MNARSSWSATADPKAEDPTQERSDGDADLPLDDLLDARFDDEGRLAQVGQGRARLLEDHFEPRAPDLGAEELERAVQKLAHGLDAIERQSRGAPQRPTSPAVEGSGGRDFVTYSLDRLEARLEALSNRLQQRAGAADPPQTIRPQPIPAMADDNSLDDELVAAARRGDPSLAVEPAEDREVERAELRRLAEVERARVEAEETAAEMRRRMEAVEARRQAEAEEASRRAEAENAFRRAEAEEMRLRAEAEEARRRAEIEAAERRSEAAASRRQAEIAATIQRQFDLMETRIEALQKHADENQIEPIRNDLLELLEQMQGLGHDGRSIAGAVEKAHARLDEIDVKVNAARNMAGNRLGDVHDRLTGIAGRLDELEIEIPGFDAVRENQGAILERFDRMEGLVQHLASADELLDRVGAVKRQLQAVASQREVARIEEQMLRLADRIDQLPEHLSDAAVLARVETQLQGLAAEALEARRQRSSAAAQLDQRLSELGGLVQEVGDSGRTPDLTGLDGKLSDIRARIEEDSRVKADSLARLEQRLAAATAVIEEQEKGVAAEILAVLTPRIDSLGEAIVSQDALGARRDIGGLDRKLDRLAQSLSEQAEQLSRPQMAPLETRLDLMQAQMEELSKRARDSTAQLGPFAQKLQEISDRVGALGIHGAPTPLSQRLAAIEERIAGLATRGADPRALQTQLDAIVSRLELLKGRSIDPARLNDLFDRVDVAIRALPEDRFDRIERKLDDTSVPAAHLERIERQIAERAYDPLTEERFDRLERRLSERDISADLEEHFALLAKRLHNAAPADISDERFARLEEKLDSIGRAYMSSAYGAGGAGSEALTPDDLADLRSDIVTLRRELRSLPGIGAGDADLGDMLRTISARLDQIADEPPLPMAEMAARLERIAQASNDPAPGRAALGHIEQSLKAIEERLVETRRPNPYQSPEDSDVDLADRELEAVAGIARALSDDVSVLKGSAEAAERKTKDSLDAVQDTLEAVVKRMAFLERDIDSAAASGELDGREAYRPEPEIRPAAAAAIVEPDAPKPEPRETSGGLLSRFTSRQLLKRATGGRAESFTPDLDEPDEDSDLPLEPNTDAPLTSDLSGAPSSDTALMSGSRSRGRTASAAIGERDPESSRARYAVPDDLDDDDFLAAARRAARAAAAEAVAEDEIGPAARAARMVGRVRSRRLAVLACALAIAVAFAAFQIVRGQIEPGDAGIAARPQATERAAAITDRTPPASEIVVEPETTEAMAPAPRRSQPPPAAPEAEEKIAAAETADVSAAPSEDNVAAAGARTATPAAPAQIAAREGIAPPSSSTRTAPAEREEAALDPASEPAAGPSLDNALPVEQTSLPASIGPERLREAALGGDPVAAFEIATRFAEGRNVTQDMIAAVAWYEQAGEAEMAPAQYRLGSIYEKGIGVPRDLARAQEWYRQAADAGNVKAMHNLAVLYAEGAGGDPDLEAAARLFRQAAEHGVRDSQFNLAILHARGLGVPQDLIEAYKWFAIAASSGDEESLKRRDIIAAALSESDLGKAEAASAAFQPLPLIAEVNEVMMPEGGWGEDATSVETESGTEVSDNDLVALVQKLLAEKGFDPGPSDGLLGRQTIDAISAYQEKAGLPVTGQIDNGLVVALREQST